MKRVVFVVVSLAVLVAGFLFAASRYREQRTDQLSFMAQENASTFVRPHSHRLGPADAKVFLVEFTDPACGTCAAFSQLIHSLMEAHPGKIQLILRYAPFHEGSVDAVRMIEAAGMQDKFWPTLELAYRSQSAWTENHQVNAGRLWQVLSQSGLDMERLSTDVNDPKIMSIIQQDQADAEALFVRLTPGIFVNGRPLEPFGAEEFKALIEDEVRVQYPD